MGNFHPLEVVGRGSETQLQVGENSKYLIQRLAFKALNYFCINHGDQRVFHLCLSLTLSDLFEYLFYRSTIIINNYVYSYSAGIDFRRQNLTSTDVGF